jgi:hypothetical protein
MEKLLSKARMLLAIVVGCDGRTSKKRFCDRYSAIQWLEGLGSASFKGKIERIELYDDRERLIWISDISKGAKQH